MKLTTTTGGGSTLLTIRLLRDVASSDTDEEILREQLDAMDTFADGWLEPLALSLDVACCDPEQGYSSYGVPPPPISSWFLRTSSRSGVAMEPTVAESTIVVCASINRQELESFVRRALNQRCVGNAVTGPEILSWEAFRVKLPTADVETFVIDDGSLLQVPIERRPDGDWVSGPRSEAVTGKPFWFHLLEGTIRFDVVWGFWLDGPGRKQVEAALERVVARGTGWYREP